jgi:spore coat protein E
LAAGSSTTAMKRKNAIKRSKFTATTTLTCGIHTTIIQYRDKDNLISDDTDIIVRVIQQPNCLECTISPNGNKIVVDVEREFIAEVIGETKVCVAINPEGCGNKDDDFYDDDDLDEELEDLSPDLLLGEEE